MPPKVGPAKNLKSSPKNKEPIPQPHSKGDDLKKEEEEEEGFDSDEYYDSDGESDGEKDDKNDDLNGDDRQSDSSEDEFEQQSSEDGDESIDSAHSSSDDEIPTSEEARQSLEKAEEKLRSWSVGKSRSRRIFEDNAAGLMAASKLMNTDDLSSDDEDAEGNTVGRIPLHWYDAYDHIGYDAHGEKVMKRKGTDRLDLAIQNAEDGHGKHAVYDMYNDRDVVLSKRDIEIIRRIQAGALPHPEHNDTPDYVDYFSSEKEVMPISGRPEPKHRFLPSKWEMIKVRKIVKAIKEGRYQTIEEKEQQKRDSSALPPVYMIWNDDADEILADSKRNKYHLPAPKLPLPGHAESYNPPAEYLLSEDERKQIEDMDPSDRPYNFVPKQHSCLRHVAGYKDFVKESFERCLDLYMCPRKMKLRLNIDPETLVPRLPKPQELRPFPNSLCLQFLGHKKAVRTISLSPDGQYLVSGSEDGTVRLWETDTCLCRHIWQLGAPVALVAWNPSSAHHLVAAAAGNRVVFIATGTGDEDSAEVTETLLGAAEEAAKLAGQGEAVTTAAAGSSGEGASDDEDLVGGEDDDDAAAAGNVKGSSSSSLSKVVATWSIYTGPGGTTAKAATAAAASKASASEGVKRHGYAVGPRVILSFPAAVTHLAWHHKGDYVVTLVPDAGSKAVAIHQLSKGKTQTPFTKSPGRVQSVVFHPSRPFIFVVTQQHVKVFHLIEQKLVKKLMSGCKWLSSVDVHQSGDHVVVGSYDRRVVWFDLDLSSTPFKTLKFHEKAVRGVQIHRRYPLMASASDDGTVHIFHSTVYSDLSRNPLIVPLKILRGHGVKGGMSVLAIAFHPRQPWIFTSGVDGVINLFQDV